MMDLTLPLRLRGYRFPRSVIAYAVWSYDRFNLSLRDVEDLLTARGVTVSYGRGRVAGPFGFAFTDPGRRLSRTRLFPEVTRVMPRVVSRDV